MSWEPKPGDIAYPNWLSRGSYVVIIESADDTVKFRTFNPGQEPYEQTVRLSTFLGRYEPAKVLD